MKVSSLCRGPGGRIGRTRPSDRVRWLVLFRKSGLTQREFARTHGFSVASLQNWMRWERRDAGLVPFQEIRIHPEPAFSSPGWDAEVGLSSGVSIRMRGELAREVVAELIRRP